MLALHLNPFYEAMLSTQWFMLQVVPDGADFKPETYLSRLHQVRIRVPNNTKILKCHSTSTVCLFLPHLNSKHTAHVEIAACSTPAMRVSRLAG